jgi:hypothetical protein
MVHSKVRHLLYDGDGQLVPHVREQTGEQLLHHLAGQGAAGHPILHEVIGQRRLEDPVLHDLITRAEKILSDPTGVWQ